MDCAPTDTGPDAVDTLEAEDVVDGTTDDTSSASSGTSCGEDGDDGEDAGGPATWAESCDDADAARAGDRGTSGGAALPTADTGDTPGGHCGPADSPTLSAASPDGPTPDAPPRDVTAGSVTPAAASSGTALVALPEHVGVPGEHLGSPDGARIVTPGVFTPTSFDAAGNATHVSYSGVVEPARTSVTLGGHQSTPVDAGITDPTYWRMREMMNQTNADIATSWLTGVTVDRSGSSPVYYGDGKPFDDFGEALGNERDPR